MSATIVSFVQARMSSQRFPGKVLAPFRGQPLIKHVLMAVMRALPVVKVIVVTSDEESDDPLATYVREIGIPVFRGSLKNVFQRFRMCALRNPCDWILRISGDSPLLDARILQAVVDCRKRMECDLVTTIFPRTFPRGQNAELIRVSTFLEIDPNSLSPIDQEHVTPFFYHNCERFHIINIESGDPRLAETSLTVDTLDDLYRLEQLDDAELRSLSFPGLGGSVET